MAISDIVFQNFKGTLAGSGNVVQVSCSKVHPCSGIYFSGMKQVGSTGATTTGSCKYTASKGIHGLSGC